jgi:hypothetical protein
MKTSIKLVVIGFLLFFSTSGYSQNCKGIAVKYTLDTVKASPYWSVVYLQLPLGAHLDSIYGGIRRPGYTGASLSYSCYSIGTTNDTDLINPATGFYNPYTGPYSQWINMAHYNVVGLSNSYIQISITTSNGMLLDSVKIAYSCLPTGINEVINSDNEISVYPNPATGLINIEPTSRRIREIIITDMLGRQVYDETFSRQLDISALSNGIYVIAEIDESGNIYRQKIIKQ